MKILTDIIQGSTEWHDIRRGKATASRASDIITPAKGELSKSVKKYIASLIAESWYAESDVPDFETLAMKRGKELEPIAREAFIAETGAAVSEVGLVIADNGVCACSPDGLIKGPDGNFFEGLEIKCPLKDSHAEYVLDGCLPEAYKAQIHWSLAVTGLSRWNFWSFHPKFKPLHIVVERDDYTQKVAAAMEQFSELFREAWAKANKSLYLDKIYTE